MEILIRPKGLPYDTDQDAPEDLETMALQERM